MTSHQSRTMVWPYEKFKRDSIQAFYSKIHNPNKITLPLLSGHAYNQENSCRFHDCVTAMDLEVGNILDQLKKDGLAEDTIVFSFLITVRVCPDTNEHFLKAVCMYPCLFIFRKMGKVCYSEARLYM